VTKEESIQAAHEEALNFFGVGQLDVLVNNAGVMGEREGWRLCMDINLNGVLKGSQLVRDSKMNRQNGGRGGVVLNVASILGLFNGQQPKGWAYNVSKSAVVAYTRCVGSPQVEGEEGIRFLCLCPSVTSTPILDGCTRQELDEMRRSVGGFMSAEQVGEAFETLLSSGETGAVMAVWKDCPAYYVPDSGMALFIFFTTFAMIFRFL